MSKIVVTVTTSPAGPTSFTLGNRTLAVAEPLDGWHGEDYSYYKVLADDGNIYILKEARDGWELIMMESGSHEPPAQPVIPAAKEAGG